MTTLYTKSGRRFESFHDLIEATSMHRPNPDWVYVDPQGHEHRWTLTKDGVVIQGYHPSAQADVLSCGWQSVDYYTEEGEKIDIGYHICAQCGVRINPGYMADETHQYVRGLRHFRIDGKDVSPDVFKAELRKEGVDVP